MNRVSKFSKLIYFEKLERCVEPLAGITDGAIEFNGGIIGKPAPIGGKTPAIVEDVIAAIALAAFAARLKLQNNTFI